MIRGVHTMFYSAQAEDLNGSIIDGQWVMRDRIIPGLDPTALARDLQKAGDQMWANVSKGDWAGRSIDQLSPGSFPPFSA